jgi:aminopeptidase-like protein
MMLREHIIGLDAAAVGQELHAAAAELFPLPRSITGHGIRDTLRHIQRRLPLELHEVPSGTRILDWTVPQEWDLRSAWIKDPAGHTIANAQTSNLQVVSYSEPLRRTMSLAELKPHLHSLPAHLDWIPYRTSYYKRTWGFCIPHRLLESLKDGNYEVCVDASLEDGHLTYGECFLPGIVSEEVLISCHVCHPSLANDNLSGLVVAAALAERLAGAPHRYGYRFLFIPGTIGSIAWLAQNEIAAARVRHGLVLAGVGDAGPLTYKRSRRGDATIDRAAAHVLGLRTDGSTVVDFSPYGYDERQYCSPGFDLPVGCLMRTPFGQYPEYHTSADNLSFITPASLADTLRTCFELIEILENDGTYHNLSPKGEPQLGRRGLFDTTGGRQHEQAFQMALLWVLNQSDGSHSLLDIAVRARLPFDLVLDAAQALRKVDLLGVK